MSERVLKFLRRAVKILTPVMDRLEKYGAIISLSIILIGTFMIIAGSWLYWDLHNTLVRILESPACNTYFQEHFKFYWPFFIGGVIDAEHWSMPYDTSLPLGILGGVVEAIGGFLLCLSIVKKKRR